MERPVRASLVDQPAGHARTSPCPLFVFWVQGRDPAPIITTSLLYKPRADSSRFQLCATATVVGVSAAGYALGRPEQRPADLTHPQKRKQSSELLDSIMPSRLASSSPSASMPLGITGIATLPPNSNINVSAQPTRLSYDGRTLSGKIRRQTTADAPAQHRTDHERSTTPGSDGVAAEFGPRLTLRSRPSWMKRLSAMSGSHHSSPESSPRPESPTASYSNGSAAFSNTGSTVPIVGGQPITPLPPNKLVKRASSTRLASGSSAGSRTLSLRRPATSHQRSSFQLQHSTAHGSDVISPSVEPRPRKGNQNDTSWKQYFSVRLSKGGPFSRRTNPQNSEKGIKRILPDDRYLPTLITAKSIVTSNLDVDEFHDYDQDSVFFGSRPPSAFGLESLSLPSGRLSLSAEYPPPETSPAFDIQNEPPPRRSFSLHDLLSIGPSRKPSVRRNPPSRLTKQGGRRVVSEPLSTSSGLDTIASVEPLPKRPRITDRSIFEKHVIESVDSHGVTDPPRRTEQQLPNSLSTLTSQKHSLWQASNLHDSRATEYSPEHSQKQAFPSMPKLEHGTQSPVLAHPPTRPSKHSIATSGHTFNLGDSETDVRGLSSADDSDVEFGSDTAFDSMRTRGTRTPSNFRSPRIDTIFDESPPTRNAKASLQEILPTGMLYPDREPSKRKSQDIIEEEESIATPVRTVRSDRADDGSPIVQRLKKSRSPFPQPLTLPSSPPDMAKPLSLGTLEYDDPVMEDDEESRWSCVEDDESGSNSELDDWAMDEQIATPLPLRRSNPLLLPASSSSASATPQHSHMDPKKETKNNIFDWSEHPADNSPGNHSPPRPKTVHGKKDTDRRGSRAKGRRPPSGLHVRSQSVPVVPDLAGKRETFITNKFGTWGVGSKGVSEDWDEDFDFGEPAPLVSSTGERDEKRIDSGVVMHIPQVIREQQANVMNNIGLVREFGILIEELKALRGRAAAVGLHRGQDATLWVQIDSMIDLADQEAEDPAISQHQSPPSSPGFDMTAFEELAELPAKDRPQRKSARSMSGRHQVVSTITPTKTKKNRKSVLPVDNNVFSGQTGSVTRSQNTTPTSNITTRPRKDSEAIARSVIEALQKRNNATDPSLALHPVPSSKKVPFDTTTLRHIVPYVNSLVRKVKEQLREAEGLDPSRDPSPDSDNLHNSHPDPPFSQLFRDHSPSQNLDELNKKMKMMTVMSL
jgi:hypothetical protein